MNFDDYIKTKKKLKEALTQCEFILMYGYSGCGKTTIFEQFVGKYPHYVYLIKVFSYLSPTDKSFPQSNAMYSGDESSYKVSDSKYAVVLSVADCRKLNVYSIYCNLPPVFIFVTIYIYNSKILVCTPGVQFVHTA